MVAALNILGKFIALNNWDFEIDSAKFDDIIDF